MSSIYLHLPQLMYNDIQLNTWSFQSKNRGDLTHFPPFFNPIPPFFFPSFLIKTFCTILST